MPTPKKHHTPKHKKRDRDRKRKRQADSSPETSKKARTSSSSSSSHKHEKTTNYEPPLKTPYYAVSTTLYLTLSPKYTFTAPLLGIQRDHLDPLLMSYFPPVLGVILAYRNISFDSDTARIVSESPFAHVWVSVEFLVWRPVRGMILSGWVNMSGASHVGLLVENMWNVAIPRERIPQEWRWVEEMEVEMETEEGGGDGGYWVDGDGGKVEGLREFRVEGVKAMGHMVSMEGSLVRVAERPKNKRRRD